MQFENARSHTTSNHRNDFGWSVALDDDKAVVGCTYCDDTSVSPCTSPKMQKWNGSPRCLALRVLPGQRATLRLVLPHGHG
ncbi:MAG: hypothetical protein ACWGQW_21875 [bacterium]